MTNNQEDTIILFSATETDDESARIRFSVNQRNASDALVEKCAMCGAIHMIRIISRICGKSTTRVIAALQSAEKKQANAGRQKKQGVKK